MNCCGLSALKHLVSGLCPPLYILLYWQHKPVMPSNSKLDLDICYHKAVGTVKESTCGL